MKKQIEAAQYQVNETVLFYDGSHVKNGVLLKNTGESRIATILELPDADGDYLISFEDEEGGKQVCRTSALYLQGKYPV